LERLCDLGLDLGGRFQGIRNAQIEHAFRLFVHQRWESYRKQKTIVNGESDQDSGSANLQCENQWTLLQSRFGKILAGDAPLVDGVFVGEFDPHAVGKDVSGQTTDLDDVGAPHTHVHRLFAVQTYLQFANLRFERKIEKRGVPLRKGRRGLTGKLSSGQGGSGLPGHGSVHHYQNLPNDASAQPKENSCSRAIEDFIGSVNHTTWIFQAE
jgi:hypothetical protein